MAAENIISLVIFLMVAVMMAGIGTAQLKSKKPVGFYTGEQPPSCVIYMKNRGIRRREKKK